MIGSAGLEGASAVQRFLSLHEEKRQGQEQHLMINTPDPQRFIDIHRRVLKVVKLRWKHRLRQRLIYFHPRVAEYFFEPACLRKNC
jgi:hypothetical protein